MAAKSRTEECLKEILGKLGRVVYVLGLAKMRKHLPRETVSRVAQSLRECADKLEDLLR